VQEHDRTRPEQAAGPLDDLGDAGLGRVEDAPVPGADAVAATGGGSAEPGARTPCGARKSGAGARPVAARTAASVAASCRRTVEGAAKASSR